MAPQVAYVIPTFEWGETQDTITKTVMRGRASGLRIYLKRPWYTSGEGEKLAVVIKNPTVDFPNGSRMAEAIFTTWGNDPTKASVGAGGIFTPLAAFVALKKGSPENLFTEQKLFVSDANSVADIAAWDVKFDTDKNLYYADVMINFGISYFPFIRLALAAYQQHSVRDKDSGTDCCLSNVVQADYIQIPPPRFSSLTLGASEITVAISGSISPATVSYKALIRFVVEPWTKRSEEVMIKTDDTVLDSFETEIQPADIKNFLFKISHLFKARQRPYRVKIFEYEILQSTTPANVPFGNFSVPDGLRVVEQQRLVFADAYDVV